MTEARTRPNVLVTVLRAVVVALVLSAEIYLIVLIGEAFNPANHFSYFTVLSNVLGAVVLGIGIFRPVPDVVRGAAATYLVVTFVVYGLLLRGVDVQTPSYANWVLHFVVPILVTLEWLLAPPARRLAVRDVAWWLVFPAVYLVYTLIRGPIVGWYPYPFLDPREQGYAAVAGWCVAVAVAIVAIGALVAWVGNVRGARGRVRA
ncbi:conserved hypothetical protein [Beutenbergia cavernae DSM 12333]|uniref:Integral membrane protein n=1 Tax=Beutenbergia cavernae (strain ATCC BAA-8 / DSM 12333 / CCUG 43141 / JCM 11478 / NBRC 16432 / NCIMB 13614 / HKI 0122) TaxID=471853 RepID=C5BVT5_BEUC1|nr:Pr6Pr family membrane protein [Beutenbergia cavernae]ACQ78525.1 conserved hypothetical protein [Beutenbergia cavernae DSM 12333]